MIEVNESYFRRLQLNPEFRIFIRKQKKIWRTILLESNDNYESQEFKDMMDMILKVDVSSSDIADWNQSLDHAIDQVLEYIVAKKI
jgi:hypothetical protein